MVLFTHNVKKIKGAADKNGDVDGTCKQTHKVYLHIPTLSPTPSLSPSSFIIVSMVTGSLTGRMGLEPILPVTISIMLKL